jgi:hypothetical protein
MRLREGGAFSAGEHGRHPPALAGELLASDRVDAAHDAMQATGRDAVSDRRGGEPELEQLRSSNYPVLDLGELPGALSVEFGSP